MGPPGRPNAPAGTRGAAAQEISSGPLSNPTSPDPQALPRAVTRLTLLAMVIGATCGGALALFACRWACFP
jgi:hypothetical protein